MSDIKAIDTFYRGILYRSRLEARWAVFFHKLNLKFEYEAEGYQLPSGWYLPDFFIHDWDCFIEIKPKGRLEPDAVVKGFELQQESGKRIIILVGNPYPRDHVGLMYPGDALVTGGEFLCCSHCESGIALVSPGCLLTLKDNGCFNLPAARYIITSKLREAYMAARTARFEHGAQEDANG